ncbi:NADH-quinone oxidoreductase subunit NuoH [Bacillus sp. FJAT-27986]|uniref:NADH-quinone oxidoreductase subunit NuoH n=1 Tax=Bacillus sp. FJAT-27986 TaxID=1743146 RepID=UPI00080ADB39|nr:NADH-quinone oxidoreductase subunit NuoH [Bacillus sp. FJAT-27986]OCA88411.1 NADH-quinone oxidoreductase subunit H [Bacillus sp. FJAT-27986]
MIQNLLTSTPSWSSFAVFAGSAIVLMFVILGFVTFAILAERKVMGYMQLRHGPNQLGGKWGLLQTVADVLKLLLKEDTIPDQADKPLFKLAPFIAFAPAMVVVATLPFTEALQFADLGVGLLYYIAVSGVSTVGILAAGWASNNKYSLMGGMRAGAQMISYEVPLVMSVIGIVLLTGSLNLNDIVESQAGVWNIIRQPIAFVVFLIAAVAELNRVPFDLSEAESELVAGFHVEYSGFRWAFFMLSEYVYMFAMATLTVILFFGGWQPIPFLDWIPGAVWFSLKWFAVTFFLVWIRVTFPRLRADHLMEFGWKVLLPVALLNIFVTALLIKIIA